MDDRQKEESALMKAIRTGNLDRVRELLASGDVDINAVDALGNTPLFEALKFISHGDAASQLIFLLIENGANLFATDKNGKSAFAYIVDHAFKSNKKDLLEKIIKSGTLNLHALTKENKTTLHMLADFGNIEGVKYLLDLGFNINALDANGRTALFSATENLATLQFLLKRGLDVHAVDKNGMTLLHVAAQKIYANTDVITFLIQQGLDPNAADHTGMTPLHYAARENSLEKVKCLVENGAESKRYIDPKDKSKSVKFPIDLTHRSDIRQFFITHARKEMEASTPAEVNKTWTTLPPDIMRRIADNVGDVRGLSQIDKETRRQLFSEGYLVHLKENIKPYNEELCNALTNKFRTANQPGVTLPKMDLFAEFIDALVADERTDTYIGFLKLITQDKYKDLIPFLRLESKDFSHPKPQPESKSISRSKSAPNLTSADTEKEADPKPPGTPQMGRSKKE